MDPAITEQLAYYNARASEYDQWWHRVGRYDHGVEENKLWFDEAAELDRQLHDFEPAGDVLELACGTGVRTTSLLRVADSVTAVDGSEEMLSIHEAQVQSAKVQRVHADLFEWSPDQKYDVVYFGFWLSHVPPDRFDRFWDLVRDSLKPNGRFFFVDSKRAIYSAAKDHATPTEDSIVHQRRLNDGREFRVFKVFYDTQELQRRLTELGWECHVGETKNYFIHGHGAVNAR